VSEPREEAAALLDRAAAELESAARHCEVAASHFREGDVPRAAAHAWAALGHIKQAEEPLYEQAREHARKSSV
jgi:hypothetical protein